ncbi:hypothetical protein B0T25DRAFT_543811 [Lasiosphaeria hispida]|uniref:Secreted protein n=1 Tax=Lasiosphaeria hispida TaxID=260671 RepID=A0AAJ0HIT9_9PEZI|nr:hypothetical protein B0T25DRAFT_543811 [Lasiosphaeria hispida]
MTKKPAGKARHPKTSGGRGCLFLFFAVVFLARSQPTAIDRFRCRPDMGQSHMATPCAHSRGAAGRVLALTPRPTLLGKGKRDVEGELDWIQQVLA